MNHRKSITEGLVVLFCVVLIVLLAKFFNVDSTLLAGKIDGVREIANDFEIPLSSENLENIGSFGKWFEKAKDNRRSGNSKRTRSTTISPSPQSTKSTAITTSPQSLLSIESTEERELTTESTTERATTPSTTKRAITINTTERATTINTTKRATTINTTERATTINTTKRATTSTTTKRATTPTSTKRATTPTTTKRATTPTTTERATTPTTTKRATTPTTTKRATTPTTTKRATTPTTTKRATTTTTTTTKRATTTTTTTTTERTTRAITSTSTVRPGGSGGSGNSANSRNPYIFRPPNKRPEHPNVSSSFNKPNWKLFGVKSFAGYLTVNESLNSNLFFWFVPAQTNSDSAPVVLCLEGRLGTSSLFSALYESGPFLIGWDKRLKRRYHSWHKKYNMIYIDSPVGVGYSFTHSDAGYATSDQQIGDDLQIAMVKFFGLFPSFLRNPFFVASQSFGGKYVIAVCLSIHKYNLKVNTNEKIRLNGLAIGNGWIHPQLQLTYGNHLYNMGLINAKGRDQFLRLERIASNYITAGNFRQAYYIANDLIWSPKSLLKNLTGYNQEWDIRRNEFGRPPSQIFTWINSRDVREALHVGDNSFIDVSQKVLYFLKNDISKSAAESLAFLLDYYRVLIYTGDLDIACSSASVQGYIERLAWAGVENFKRTRQQPWLVDGGQLAGYIKKFDKLITVVMRNAGHYTSVDQPKWTLDLIERFTKGSI